MECTGGFQSQFPDLSTAALLGSEVRFQDGLPGKIHSTSRVTLKIDVSHTDHSHMIGRGGRNIKAVMLDTQCHIHFPDSNRTNLVEKSNQVSISGDVSNVERARQRIRDMLPVTFCFIIPFTTAGHVSAWRNSLLVRQIEKMYGVEVSYRSASSFSATRLFPPDRTTTVVTIKGLAVEVKKIKSAVRAMIDQHYSHNAQLVPVEMSMELGSSYQNAHLRQRSPDLSELVFQTTGARLTFYDSHVPPPSTGGGAMTGNHSRGSLLLPMGQQGKTMGSPSRRGLALSPLLAHCWPPTTNNSSTTGFRLQSTLVHISGTVDSVFLARQLLISLLPVTLLFDVSLEESRFLEGIDFSKLNEYYDVFIVSRNRPRQLPKSIVIRTLEKNIRALYTVHCKLMHDLTTQLEMQVKAEYDYGFQKLSTLSDVYSTSCNRTLDRNNPNQSMFLHGTLREADEKQPRWPFQGELLSDRANLRSVVTDAVVGLPPPPPPPPERDGSEDVLDRPEKPCNGLGAQWFPELTTVGDCRTDENGVGDSHPWLGSPFTPRQQPTDSVRWRQTPRLQPWPPAANCQYTPPPRASASATSDAALSLLGGQADGDFDNRDANLWTVGELTDGVPETS